MSTSTVKFIIKTNGDSLLFISRYSFNDVTEQEPKSNSRVLSTLQTLQQSPPIPLPSLREERTWEDRHQRPSTLLMFCSFFYLAQVRLCFIVCSTSKRAITLNQFNQSIVDKLSNLLCEPLHGFPSMMLSQEEMNGISEIDDGRRGNVVVRDDGEVLLRDGYNNYLINIKIR